MPDFYLTEPGSRMSVSSGDISIPTLFVQMHMCMTLAWLKSAANDRLGRKGQSAPLLHQGLQIEHRETKFWSHLGTGNATKAAHMHAHCVRKLLERLTGQAEEP